MKPPIDAEGRILPWAQKHLQALNKERERRIHLTRSRIRHNTMTLEEAQAERERLWWVWAKKVRQIGLEPGVNVRNGKYIHPCGTAAGYERHRYYGEKICDPCRKAAAAYYKKQRAERIERQFVKQGRLKQPRQQW